MNYSLVLLTATWLPGDPMTTPVYAGPNRVQPVPQIISVEPTPDSGRVSLRERIRGLFRPASSDVRVHSTAMPAPAMMTPMAAPAPVQHTTLKPAVEVETQYQNKVGHAEDYAWVTGQLFRVHASGGMWLLRYASVGEEDRYGGGVVISGSVDMKNFREGDLVSVNGEIMDAGRPTKHLGAPLYRATSIHMVDRADSSAK